MSFLHLYSFSISTLEHIYKVFNTVEIAKSTTIREIKNSPTSTKSMNKKNMVDGFNLSSNSATLQKHMVVDCERTLPNLYHTQCEQCFHWYLAFNKISKTKIKLYKVLTFTYKKKILITHLKPEAVHKLAQNK